MTAVLSPSKGCGGSQCRVPGARDDLAEILMTNTMFRSAGFGEPDAAEMADAILADGWTKPETITG